MKFELALEWWPLEQRGTSINNSKGKDHQIIIDGKSALNVSAAPKFKGNSGLHNPEDLLLSALSSCHFMSFYYLCQTHQLTLIQYKDKAEASLKVNADGSGSISSIHLRPVCIFNPSITDELLNTLHQEAHNLCFIANSLKVPISIAPSLK